MGFLTRRCEHTGFSPHAERYKRKPLVHDVSAAFCVALRYVHDCEPEKYKESVFESPILLQNQANPQIL